MFWLTALMLITPFPLKAYNIVTGKDQRSLYVKLDEMLNALVLMIGLVGFFSYAYNTTSPFSSGFWMTWLVVVVTWSIIALAWSPKLEYARKEIGGKAAASLIIFSTAFMMPMLIAVYLHAVAI